MKNDAHHNLFYGMENIKTRSEILLSLQQSNASTPTKLMHGDQKSYFRVREKAFRITLPLRATTSIHHSYHSHKTEKCQTIILI
jgi:hypothetical protein